MINDDDENPTPTCDLSDQAQLGTEQPAPALAVRHAGFMLDADLLGFGAVVVPSQENAK